MGGEKRVKKHGKGTSIPNEEWENDLKNSSRQLPSTAKNMDQPRMCMHSFNFYACFTPNLFKT